jgi:hypothetical protein
MPKLVLSDVTNLQNEQSTIATLAANNRAIEAMIERLLNRDGLSPNHMTSELDMNSNRIINLPAPIADTEPVRLTDLSGGLVGFDIAGVSLTTNTLPKYTGSFLVDSGISDDGTTIDLSRRMTGVSIYLDQTNPTWTAEYPIFSDPPQTYLAPNVINTTWDDVGVAYGLLINTVIEPTASPDLVLGASGGGLMAGVYVKTNQYVDPAGIVGIISNDNGLTKSTGAAIWALAREWCGEGATDADLFRATSETRGDVTTPDHPSCGLRVTSLTQYNSCFNGVFIASAYYHGFVVGGSSVAGGIPTYPFRYYNASDVAVFTVDASGYVDAVRYYIQGTKFAEQTGGFNIIYAPNGTGSVVAADNNDTYIDGNTVHVRTRAGLGLGFFDASGYHTGAGQAIILTGATSGVIAVKAPSVAGSNTITFPAGTTDFSATGGSGQVVKQTSAGGAFTVAAVAASEVTFTPTGGIIASTVQAALAELDSEKAFALSFSIGDEPGDNEIIEGHVFTDDITFPSGLGTSQAYARTTSTGSAVFDILFNDTPVGTVTFSSGNAVGSFSLASPIVAEAGDRLDIQAPSPADATLAGIKITLRGAPT